MSHEQLMKELEMLVQESTRYLAGIGPRLAGALALALLGLGLAFLVRVLTRRLIAGLDRLVTGLGGPRLARGAEYRRGAGRAAGRVLFWVVLLFFLAAATETLGLPVISVWLSGLLVYLPRFAAAVLILFAGLLGGHFLRNLILSGTASAGVAYGAALARLGQMTAVVVSVLVAVAQAGLNVSFLTSLLLLVLGSGLLGGVLTFALGARTTVANILACHYLQKTYRVGHRVRAGGFEGEIVEITATSVVLETEEGRVSVPASVFGQETTVLLVERT